MGVKGLWKLLESVGRPVTLESLENKILGVDASVILNQSVKGIRDKQGNPVPNAHLVGLFSRLCKLLYYRIKPVFVFDGGVPYLKKKTLAARKEQRFKAVHKSKRAAEKIIKNYLKTKALETVTKRKSSAIPVRSRSPREPDVFELPPLPPRAITDAKSSSEDEDMDVPILEQFQREQVEETFQDPNAIDIDSEDFKALPPEIQHELIKDIKAERIWMSKNILPRQATDFSSFQLEGVLKRGKMNQRLEDLRKEMNQRNSGELAGMVSDETVGEESAVKSQKILSEDAAHYILIKRNEQEQKQSKDFSDEGGFFREDQEGEIVSWTDPRPKPVSPRKIPSFEIADLCSSDSEILSPFLDVPEADLSPSSCQAQSGAFSFSLIKIKGRIENGEGNLGENVTKSIEAPTQKSQTYDNLLPGSENAKSVDKNSKIDNLRDLSDHEAKLVISGEDSDEDNELLTQIKDKKKELEDLLRKWKASKHQKAAGDEIASSGDDRNVGEINEKELAQRSLESVEVFNISGRQPECCVFEKTENTPSTLIIDDQIESKGKAVDDLLVSDGESESETNSVEEVRVVKPEEGFPENLNISSSDTLQETQTTDPSFNIAEEEKRAVSSGGVPEIQSTPFLNGGATSEVIEDEKSPISPDVQLEVQDTAPDAKIDPDNRDARVEEKRDSVEKNEDQMDVSEPVAGPSGLPVEWQGATVEELEDIRLDIEAEQKSLASEQARQNRIAASVSNEMFAECQELLQLFGVPYLVSPMEAEAQCAALDRLGLTEGSITDDSDIFLFGGRRVYKNIFNQNKHVEMYGSDAVLRNLALDRSSLICIAFITGSDYTEGLPGVGTVGAIELLHEFSGEGLEGLKKFKSWHEEVKKRTKHPQETKVKRKMRSVELPSDFPAEEVYEAYLHPVVDESSEQFEWGKPDLHSLRLFASDKFGWSSARTDEVLLPVLKQFNKNETQMKISDYFEVKFQETRTIKSKRIKRVLNRKFNQPSGSSDGKDGVEDNKEQRQHKGEIPSKKTNRNPEVNDEKRTLSTKKSASKHDNEADAERAKKDVDGDSVCAFAVTRSSGRKRGRGRGRGTAWERNKANDELKLSVAARSSKRVTRKQLSQENKKRPRKTRSRSSTSADTEKETLVDQVPENDKKRRKQQSPAANRKKNDSKCIAQDDDSTSDTTDSEDFDENFYAGPNPVSVFARGRGRASVRPRGRVSRRGK